MKTFAKFMTFVTVVVLLALAYVMYASQLIVDYEGVTVASCADHPETFSTLRGYAQSGSAEVTAFTDAPGPNAGDYKFVTYTVRVRNLNLLDAEWMDLSIQNKEGDLLQTNLKVEDLAAFNDTTVNITLVCERGVTDLARQATLSYYVYGRYYKVDVSLNG